MLAALWSRTTVCPFQRDQRGLSHQRTEGHPGLVVVLLQDGPGCGPLGAEDEAQQRQRHPHKEPQRQEGEGHGDLHEVEDGRAELAQHAGEEEGGQGHAGVERQLGQHEDVLAAAVAHVRVQRLALAVERHDPDGELEDAGEEDDGAADLDGLALVLRVLRELVRELVGQRQAAHEGQREGVHQAHEARGLGDVQEERVVHEPQQAHGDEGAEVGQVLGSVGLQRRDQAAAKLPLHHRRVRNVVLAETEIKARFLMQTWGCVDFKSTAEALCRYTQSSYSSFPVVPMMTFCTF